MKIGKIELEYDLQDRKVKVRSKDRGFSENIDVVLTSNGDKRELYFNRPSNEWQCVDIHFDGDRIPIQVKIITDGRDPQNYSLFISTVTGEIIFLGEETKKTQKPKQINDLDETKPIRRSGATKPGQFFSEESHSGYGNSMSESPIKSERSPVYENVISQDDYDKIQPLLFMSSEELDSMTLLVKLVNSSKRTAEIPRSSIEILSPYQLSLSSQHLTKLLESWLHFVSSDAYFEVFSADLIKHQKMYKSLNEFHSSLWGLVEDILTGLKQEDQIAVFFKDRIPQLRELAESLLKIRQFTEDQKYIDFIEKYLTSFFVTREAIKYSDGA